MKQPPKKTDAEIQQIRSELRARVMAHQNAMVLAMRKQPTGMNIEEEGRKLGAILTIPIIQDLFGTGKESRFLVDCYEGYGMVTLFVPEKIENN